MNLNKKLIELLRTNVKQGLEVNELIKLIQEETDPEEFNSFLVMNYFMEAFHLSFSQVREMPGAICLGGGAYTNKEINELIYKSIKN